MPAQTMEGKVEQIIAGNTANGFIGQNFSSIKFSGIWCDFWAVTPEQLAIMFGTLYGREVTEDEVMEMGERIWNLARLYNLREGVEKDDIPKKLYELAHTEGPSAGKVVGDDLFHASLQKYYSLRGWDENGVPTEAKLAELGVDVRL
jgi:aldehyde:ferredoxin oxidoreductase